MPRPSGQLGTSPVQVAAPGPTTSAQQVLDALMASDDLVCAIDTGRHFTLWNRGCERLYGWPADEVLGRTLHLYVPDDQWAELETALQAVWAGEQVPPMTTVRLTKDGRRVDVSTRLTPLRSDDGRVVGGLCVARDITLEMACRREVDEGRSHLHARLDQTDVAHATVSPKGVYTYANHAYCRLLGRDHEEVVGARVLTFSSPEDVARSWTPVRELARGERDGLREARTLIRPDGSAVHVIVHASTIWRPDGDVGGVAVTLQDVTELQDVHDALRTNAARWRSIALNAVDVGFLAEPDGTVTYATEALVTQFGYQPEQVVGLVGFDFFHPEDVEHVRTAWDEVASGRTPRLTVEARVRHASGHWVWVEETMASFLDDPEVAAMVATVRDVSLRKSAELRVGELSLSDQLTGVANRALLVDRTTQALARSVHTGRPVGTLVLGLDDFSTINDQLGHAHGDEVLVAVADLLGAGLEQLDTLARIGGDLFAILLEDAGDEDSLRERAQCLQSLLLAGVAADGSIITLTASVGVALRVGGQAESLLAAAEAALRTAKSHDPGSIETYSETSRARSQHRREAVSDLRRGIEAGELVVHYQPLIELSTGSAVGVEALVRWQHRERGLLPPGEFLPLAEESGLIVALGRDVLRQACHALARWPLHDGTRLTMAVNLSLRQLAEPGIVGLVQQTLAETGLPGAALCLEVTETAVTHDVESTSRTLHALRELGITLAIDDFGTGYSSLTYLRQFPVSTVKIDRSFVHGLGVDSDDTAIVSSVISLARAIGTDCIAEGIEQPEQAQALRSLGCALGQGFLWSRPLPEDELLAWLEQPPAPMTQLQEPTRSCDPRSPAVAAPSQALQRIAELQRQGASLHTIAAALNAEGVPGPNGSRWHARSVARALAGPA